MSMVLSILGLGFLLGLRHATDADHVVAITTFSAREHGIKSSSLIGILWGIGHSITVTLIAIPIIFFSFVIPPRVGLGLEFCVGIMLVILGLINLFGLHKKFSLRFAPVVHSHEHIHETSEGKNHSHPHAHIFKLIKADKHHLGVFHSIRPLIVGLVHGLAGSAAIVLLILSTINNPIFATIYLFIFHIGVIIGMMIITTLLGVSIAYAEGKSRAIHKYLILISGALSFIFGLFIMYETGIQGTPQ